EDHCVQDDLEETQIGMAKEEDRGRQSAQQGDGQLNLDEHPGQLLVDEARQPGADTHREEVDADDGRELKDRVAEQVAGRGARKQLVDQAAGGDDQDVQEQEERAVHLPPRGPPWTMMKVWPW